MADPSNPSNISSHKELLQEYRRECDQADERLLLSYYRKIEQGVIKIKEWKPPSTIDLLKEVQSSNTLSDALSDFVQYLIDVTPGLRRKPNAFSYVHGISLHTYDRQ